MDLVADARHRARLLHKRAIDGDASAIALVRSELSDGPDAVVKRRHCLTTVAKMLGFAGWPHAKQVLSGDRPPDMGTLAFADTGGAIWNVWSASYTEAADIRQQHGGYLLPYRRHFQIVEAPYIDALGSDPKDPDWESIGRDWVQPKDRRAWRRLTSTIIRSRLDRDS